MVFVTFHAFQAIPTFIMANIAFLLEAFTCKHLWELSPSPTL